MHDPSVARSRFQVLSEGVSAWAVEGDRFYYFDGFRFWEFKSRRARELKVSWQTPRFGWTTNGAELAQFMSGGETERDRLSA